MAETMDIENKPVIFPDGTRKWYANGVLHRENGPAVEDANGKKKEWYFRGKRHREDGPAFEIENVLKAWHKHGVRHRVDGPALEFEDMKEWYFEGKLHRIGGPAVERGGHIEFWEHGVRVKFLNHLQTKLTEETECPICSESFNDIMAKTPCNHHFCETCLESWLKDHDTCPLCRQKIEV